ncbi:hypothetical protein RQP46_006444 [Phenoliferia psychrophenolica]
MPAQLFTPITIGPLTLRNRFCMAPLTRFRAHANHVQSSLAVTYYAQRAESAGLLITEATFIQPQAGGFRNIPGIWNEEQVKAWKDVVDAVHAKGCPIYLQLWALGRGAQAVTLANEGPYTVVSASNIPLAVGAGRAADVPRPLSDAEIEQYIVDYAAAAKAFVGAGGDGVEIHAANYLIDQFTQKNSNIRTDKWGGSVVNRTRFALEVTAACVKAVGMKMERGDLVETFSYLVNQLKAQHPSLAYLHLTEPRVAGGGDQTPVEGDDLEFLHKIWSPKVMIVAGGFTPESGIQEAEKRPNVAVAYGRMFISNPDLPVRIEKSIKLEPYNRKTFYTEGPNQPVGYVDYLTAAQSGKL